MKRFWMIFVIIALLIGLFAVSASAEGGTFCGLSWDVTDGVLTLGRIGETQDVTFGGSDWPWLADETMRLSITSVETEGNLVFHNGMNRMFYRCSNLASIDVDGWDTSNVTQMEYVFNNTSVMSLDLSGFDVSHVTNMAAMFQGCHLLRELNITGWDTSSATNMWCLFNGCYLLESIDVANWDVSHVTAMGSIFYECKSVTELAISNWNTSSVTDLSSAFYGCANITSLDLSGWNVSNVIGFGGSAGNSGLFNGCTSLTFLDVSTWDTSNVKDMGHVFANCSLLTDIDVSEWNTSNVTSMVDMFSGDVKLISLDVSGFDTSKVKDMSRMFYNCSKLESIGVVDWDTSSLTNIRSIFYGCASLKTLDLSGWDVSGVTTLVEVFGNCSSLVSLDVSTWDTSNVIALGDVYYSDDGVFYNCKSLVNLDVSMWDVSSVTCMNSAFLGCESLTELDVSIWDTSKVTSMKEMFNGCSLLRSLDVSAWDVSHVTSMEKMFRLCTVLSDLDVSTWNTSSVGSIFCMFQGCRGLVELDVSNFDTSQVWNMGMLFESCSSLISLNVGGWNTAGCRYFNNVFQNCIALKSLDLTGWDFSQSTSMNVIFSGCDSLCEVILDNPNLFQGSTTLPVPPAEKDDILYTQKWIREDETYGPYTASELHDNYTASMTGKWVWEKVPIEYSITFVCTEDGYLGNMPYVTALANEDYVLPMNSFRVFGKVFDHWTDGTRRIYADGATIPANTYVANDVVTLTAVFEPRNTSIQMQDGQFTFSIKGDEKALFENVLAGTSYQVFEENLLEDWVLIQQYDSTGLIYPLEEAQALFLNKYQPDIATMQFTGRKLMDGQPATAGSFAFELWEGNVLLQTKSVVDGGFVQFDILEYDRTDEGVHTYTIKELIGTDETLLYDGHEETIAVEVTTDISAEDNIVRVHAEVTYSDGTYPDIVFQNWTKPGELTLKKLVDGLLAGHEGDEFRFRIIFKQDNGLPLEDELTYSITDP